jgi:cytochrome P450
VWLQCIVVVGRHHVPTGTLLLVNAYAIQWDPTIWPELAAYKLERLRTASWRGSP